MPAKEEMLPSLNNSNNNNLINIIKERIRSNLITKETSKTTSKVVLTKTAISPRKVSPLLSNKRKKENLINRVVSVLALNLNKIKVDSLLVLLKEVTRRKFSNST